MLHVEIKTTNAAFGEDLHEVAAECADILRNAAAMLERGSAEGTLMDSNGNTVGSWRLDPPTDR